MRTTAQYLRIAPRGAGTSTGSKVNTGIHGTIARSSPPSIPPGA